VDADAFRAARPTWLPHEIERALLSKQRCQFCRLGRDKRTGFVAVASNGSPSPQILIVGEAPGGDEDRQGIAFIGRAAEHGKMLLQNAGVPLSAVRFTNTTRCFPQDEHGSPREPNLFEETAYCLGYLWEEIDTVRPKVIVALGSYPASILTGEKTGSISKMSGQLRTITVRGREYPVIMCVHFSADLRSHYKYSNAITDALDTAWNLCREIEVPCTTETVNDTKSALAFLNELLARYDAKEFEAVAYDLEWDTILRIGNEAERETYTDLFDPEKKIVMASFAWSKDRGTSIVLHHDESKVDCAVVEAKLREVLSRVPVIAHNYLKAEGPWSAMKLGVTPELHFDTMLASFVLRTKTASHGLKVQASRWLKWPNWSKKLDAVVASLPADRRSYKHAPLDLLGRYSAVDPAATWGLYEVYNEHLAEADRLLQPLDLLHRASRTFMSVELRGAFIDLDEHERLKRDYPELLKTQMKLLASYPQVKRFVDRRQADIDKAIEGTKRRRTLFAFNPGSNEHVGDVIYGEFQAPIPQPTKKERKKVEKVIGSSLDAGDQMITTPLRVPKLPDSIWIGPPDGSVETAERVKIDKQNSGDGITRFRAPVRFAHPSPFWVYLGQPSTSDLSLQWLMRETRCKPCKGSGEEQDGTCPSCGGSGRRGDRRMLAKFLQAHRDYKKIGKINDAYVQALPKFIVPNTNQLVFNYLLHGTDTGRLAARNFAVQTVPAKSDIRRLFVSQWKDRGGLIVGMDQSQVEMRVMASIAQDDRFISFFFTCSNLACGYVGSPADCGTCPKCGAKLGGDMHRQVASQVFRKDPKDVTDGERSSAKTIGFGILYGRGPASIAVATDNTIAQAEAMIRDFFGQFPGVEAWVKARHQDCLDFGYVMSACGRRLWLEGAVWKDGELQRDRHGKIVYVSDQSLAGAQRKSQNYPIQSAASDLTLEGFLNAYDALVAGNFQSRPWETTHDSIELDVYPGELLSVIKTVREAMTTQVHQTAPWLRVPLEMDVEIGVRWDGAVKCKWINEQTNTMRVVGKKLFYDDLVEQLRKVHQVDEEILKTFDDPEELKGGIRKTYQGRNGGLPMIDAQLTIH